MGEQLDPEMLNNIDLLLEMDVIESEKDWETVEEMEEVADAPDEGDTHE